MLCTHGEVPHKRTCIHANAHADDTQCIDYQ